MSNPWKHRLSTPSPISSHRDQSRSVTSGRFSVYGWSAVGSANTCVVQQLEERRTPSSIVFGCVGVLAYHREVTGGFQHHRFDLGG